MAFQRGNGLAADGVVGINTWNAIFSQQAPPASVWPPFPGVVLRRGMNGPSIRQVQERLNELGANPRLNPDGAFGPLTEAAVMAFQRGNGLAADGVVGDAVIIRPTQKTQQLSGFREFGLISCTSNNSMGLGVQGGCPASKEDKYG